ncbi:MAG: thioredoxin domain-containing protein [Gammaproteobacteria bacterium]|nr:thioredoxin domain-containing protein [Gammaproteobacteria bacterium]
MNRLAEETSPYLRQHADNPVDWYPWNDAALAKARDEDKPILLSVGYSACHWCHVMAHESFEDVDTAEVMNRHFVNIKVDREERPDLDKVYQLAHQLLTRRTGGWPLTIFLDPETLLPFFAGTYFPRTPRFNLPGFADLLVRIDEAFRTQRDVLGEQGQRLSDALSSLEPSGIAPEGLADEKLLVAARDQLAGSFDRAEGGFGAAPKFPMPSSMDRLLRHWGYSGKMGQRDGDAMEMVMISLTKIARGGIYDHVGGGFCRYSTDRHWEIPHFEKMLYDNGLLLTVYADALALGDDPLFEAAVRETAGWIMRDMQHSQGGYFSALDADSEGEEGKYYVWRRDSVKRLLTPDEYLLVETLYGLDKPANFEGRWNFRRRDAWRSVLDRLGVESEAGGELLRSAKSKLLAERDTRVPPAKDDKVLTAWNGLAIRGMARAAVRLGEPSWLRSAQRAADFVRENLWDGERLTATWRDGTPRYAGYLDDYANMLEGLIELLGAEWRDADAAFAKALANTMIGQFYDADEGGFFFTAHDHEALIHRPKPTLDESMPAGNGAAACGLTALGHLFADTRYLDAAAGTLEALRGAMEQYPAGHCTLLSAVEANVHAPEQIIVRGPTGGLDPWLDVAREGYRPWRHVYGIPYGCVEAPVYLPRPEDGGVPMRPTVFVCRGLQCSPRIDALDEFRETVS